MVYLKLASEFYYYSNLLNIERISGKCRIATNIESTVLMLTVYVMYELNVFTLRAKFCLSVDLLDTN